MKYLSVADFILTPLYLMILFAVANIIQKSRIEKNPEYKYYLKGLAVKMFGALSFCAIYVFYYGGGDTTQYFADALCVNKLLFQDPEKGLDVIIGGLDITKLSYFNDTIGYPAYFRDPSTSFVVRVVSIFLIFGFQSFIPTTLIIAYISFVGIWSLYRVFLAEYPKLGRELSISIFFIPSVFLWGSGILKDTFTLCAIGMYTHAFYYGVIKSKLILKNFFVMFISAYVIVLVKPYIFIALLPGSMIWLVSDKISYIKGKFLRFSIAPIFLFITIGGAYLLINYMGDSLGKFSSDQLLERAVITQRDLKYEFYKGNSFDIGEFDSSIESILAVSPNALIAGLFRPYIWESNKVLMLFSALENLYFLIFTIVLLIKTKVFGIFRFFFKHHLLTFSLFFSLFFSFSVGLSTSNFGSLVRYKIPAIPFYLSSLMIIRSYLKEEKLEKKGLLNETEDNTLIVEAE